MYKELDPIKSSLLLGGNKKLRPNKELLHDVIVTKHLAVMTNNLREANYGEKNFEIKNLMLKNNETDMIKAKLSMKVSSNFTIPRKKRVLVTNKI